MLRIFYFTVNTLIILGRYDRIQQQFRTEDPLLALHRQQLKWIQ